MVFNVLVFYFHARLHSKSRTRFAGDLKPEECAFSAVVFGCKRSTDCTRAARFAQSFGLPGWKEAHYSWLQRYFPTKGTEFTDAPSIQIMSLRLMPREAFLFGDINFSVPSSVYQRCQYRHCQHKGRNESTSSSTDLIVSDVVIVFIYLRKCH